MPMVPPLMDTTFLPMIWDASAMVISVIMRYVALSLMAGTDMSQPMAAPSIRVTASVKRSKDMHSIGCSLR